MAKTRRLMEIVVRRTETSAGPQYGGTYVLPMGDADADSALQCAALILKGVNAQLDYSKSDYRLAVYDTKTGKRQVMKFESPAPKAD